MSESAKTTSIPEHQPVAVISEDIALPAAQGESPLRVRVLRFGTPGARPKAYLQAGLHADELPGMLALRQLAELLTEEQKYARIKGEVILVPVSNPIGLGQHEGGELQGRFDAASGSNFNRNWPELAERVAAKVADRLGADSDANVAIIREALPQALAEEYRDAGADKLVALRQLLLKLALDADYVFDLHADNEAMLHLYTGTPLWPAAGDLAAELDARAVLLAEESGGNPFDEACSGLWWRLAQRFLDKPIPPACLASTIELRSNNEVDEQLARDDANALLRFLIRRGLIAGESAALPNLRCEATPLEAMQQLIAPADGLVLYQVRLGDRVLAGETVAKILDPVQGEWDVKAETDGVLFARHAQRYAWKGRIIGKIAGNQPLASRADGPLLSP